MKSGKYIPESPLAIIVAIIVVIIGFGTFCFLGESIQVHSQEIDLWVNTPISAMKIKDILIIAFCTALIAGR